MSYGDDYEGRGGPRPNSPDHPTLRTRKPTGRVPFPFLLLEGEPKGGKSYALAQLSNSPRVGRTFVLELGEGGMDEYASLGPFEMIVHNGTFSDIHGQVLAALAEPMVDGRPNVLGIDSGTALWGVLKDWTDRRARNSAKNRAVLQKDPDAEIDPTMNLWNDAKERWRRIVDALMAWDGIAVIVARAGEKAKVQDGQPVAGQTEYTVEAEKTLVYDVTAQVRFNRGQVPRLVAVKSLFVDVPSGGLDLPRDNALDHLIFEVMGGGQEFAPRNVVVPQVGVPAAAAKARVIAAVQRANPRLGEAEAKAEAARLWKSAGLDGLREVTEVQLRGAMPVSEGQETAQDAPGASAPSEDPPSPTKPTKEEETPETPAVDPDEVVSRIQKMGKREVVTELGKLGLSTSGNLDVLRTRLMEGLGVLEAPFGSSRDSGAESTTAPDEPGPDAPLPADLDAAPLDPWANVPADAWRGECFCGFPVWHVRGDASTLRHLDPVLDQDHQAEVPF